jgi:hypothetical protein
VPIQRLLQKLELEAEAVTRLVTAFEETLRALRLVDRAGTTKNKKGGNNVHS